MIVRPNLNDWRRFGDSRFRIFHYLALCQGVVGVLAGFDVIIPFALAIGCPPFVAVSLGVLPLLGGMTQLAMPRLLDRTGGNLRGITLMFAVVAEPRGLYYALVAFLVAGGLLVGPLAVVFLIALVAVHSIVSSMFGSNLLSWYSAILPEDDRRLVVPRMMAISLAIGAVLLVPIAVVLDGLAHVFGLTAYALPFVISGTAAIVHLVVLRRLRHPGQVIVPPRAVTAQSQASPDFVGFVRVSVLNALGMGFAPSMSVYIISVVGLTAGFSMIVGSIGTLTMVVAAAIAGDRLARGSSRQMLRRSFAIRAAAMIAPIFAFPGTVTAPIFLIASSMLGAIGFAHGSLAANERMFRLIRGPAVIRHHAHFLSRTSGAMTMGQLAGASVVAIGGAVYPAFVLLYAISSAVRVVAYRAASAEAHAPAPADARAIARGGALAAEENKTTAEAGATAVA